MDFLKLILKSHYTPNWRVLCWLESKSVNSQEKKFFIRLETFDLKGDREMYLYKITKNFCLNIYSALSLQNFWRRNFKFNATELKITISTNSLTQWNRNWCFTVLIQLSNKHCLTKVKETISNLIKLTLKIHVRKMWSVKLLINWIISPT